MITDPAKRLRSSILSSLYFAGAAMSVRQLQRELERVHGVVASAVGVRAALHYLAEQGLLQVRDDRALLTELGQDVGALRVPYED